MDVKIYKIENPDSCISEIIEIKSNTATDSLTHFVPPLGNPEIILYAGQSHQIKNVTCANGFIKGQYTVPQKIDFIPGYHFLSIRLRPYGLKRLFNINATELINSVIAIENHPTSEILYSYFKSFNKIDIPFLKSLVSLTVQHAIYPVSQSTIEFLRLASEKEVKTIKTTAFDNGIGLRTLQRNFKNEVGLSPKEYLRIKRMNKIEEKLSQNLDVFQIIADFEFSDQAHFIKDFKQLRRFTPTEILKKKLLLSDQLAMPEIIKM